MKKTIGLFAALAAMFLMSSDVYSSDEGASNNSRETIEYCVYNWNEGFCIKSIRGDACYGVDAECNWTDDVEQPDD